MATIELWRDVVDGDFELPAGSSLDELTVPLLAQLGSPDSELRETSFLILGTWIERGVYSPAELRPMRDELLRNLPGGIGGAGGDDVFARSFSALVLGKIVEYDGRHSFLSRSELGECVEAATAYLLAERDLRGFVPDKGWIHTPAHAGDLLRALAGHPGVAAGALESILGAIADKVMTPVDCVYVRLEDERLAAAAKAAVERVELPAQFAREWIAGLARPAPGRTWPDLIEGTDAEVNAWHNTRSFLRSLFFQLTLPAGTEPVPYLPAEITAALELMDLGFYGVAPLEN